MQYLIRTWRNTTLSTFWINILSIFASPIVLPIDIPWYLATCIAYWDERNSLVYAYSYPLFQDFNTFHCICLYTFETSLDTLNAMQVVEAISTFEYLRQICMILQIMLRSILKTNIIQINDGLACWCVYVSFGHSELTEKSDVHILYFQICPHIALLSNAVPCKNVCQFCFIQLNIAFKCILTCTLHGKT